MTTYILNGAGGNREGNTHFPASRPEWSASAISEWGYGVLELHNATTLSWKFYTSENNQLADEFVLTKSN